MSSFEIDRKSHSVATSFFWLRYLGAMHERTNATIGAMVRDAVKASALEKEGVLAREVGIASSALSKIINGKQELKLDLARKMDRVLGSKLAAAVEAAHKQIDLYVSSPITALGERLPKQNQQVAQLVRFLRQEGYVVHWPGEKITSTRQLKAPDIATEENLIVLANSSALLYLQFEELVGPSGALVELGIALGKEIKTTVMVKKGLEKPFMLRQGFDAVAKRVGGYPDARIYDVDSVAHAETMIAESGRIMFGLAERDGPVDEPREDSLF